MASFVSKVSIRECRNIERFDIELSSEERKHLIITGKNGSGKTSVLEAMREFLEQVSGNNNLVHSQGSVLLEFTNRAEGSDNLKRGAFVLASFPTHRRWEIRIPSTISKLSFPSKMEPAQVHREQFLQYIVNLKATRSFARDDNEIVEVEKIDAWFERFVGWLRKIYQTEELVLRFDRRNFTFDIAIPGMKPFGLHQLADGYSALLSIVSELILRMEPHRAEAYDLEGVVLIDELETHLHVDLQKLALPFLIDFFPNVQFVVTTHSPFVISSVGNAVVCDLEKRIVTEDLSGYSYGALIESYFGSDKYSERVKADLDEYERLAKTAELTEEQEDRLSHLEMYFDRIPKWLSPELDAKLQQIKLDTLGQKA